MTEQIKYRLFQEINIGGHFARHGDKFWLVEVYKKILHCKNVQNYAKDLYKLDCFQKPWTLYNTILNFNHSGEESLQKHCDKMLLSIILSFYHTGKVSKGFLSSFIKSH